MGQKANPILFRSGIYPVKSSSSPAQTYQFPHLIVQEKECTTFIRTLLESRGILLRSCVLNRTSEKLSLDLDLFFTSLFFKESKLLWVRSFFKNMKKKYKKIKRVKDLKDFLESSQTVDSGLKNDMSFADKKKFLLPSNQKSKFFLQKLAKFKNYDLTYKRRLFYLLLFQKKKNLLLKKKESHTLFSIHQNHLKTKANLVKMGLWKLNKLFGLRKIKYNFSNLFLKRFLFEQKVKNKNLLKLSQFICQSLQSYLGVEKIKLRLFSTQLLFLPSFKSYKSFLFKELALFQKSRDLRRYFLESLETFFFVLGTYGKGNASLLARLIVFLLEKNRKQLFIVKFLKKVLQVFFQKLPNSFLAVDGIKILIKGRFNKRRRTKKVVLGEGQISLQSLDTSLDYCQTQAITLYGSFGVKIWISKRKN